VRRPRWEEWPDVDVWEVLPAALILVTVFGMILLTAWRWWSG
jgi:hypothetical protein